jgi:hypothetical protein
MGRNSNVGFVSEREQIPWEICEEEMAMKKAVLEPWT